MPLIALVVLFIAVPLLELYVILQVGDAIGAVWTVLLLAADSCSARCCCARRAAWSGAGSTRRWPPAACRTRRSRTACS